VILVGIFLEPRIITSTLNGAVRLTQERKPVYSEMEMHQIYPEAAAFQANHSKIKQEFLNYMKMVKGQIPLVTEVDRGQKILNNDAGWKVVLLRGFNKDVDANIAHFPTIANIIRNSQNTVSCFFSVVEAHKQILPHTGYYGGVLRYHLGVIVPKDINNCFIEVAGNKLTWKEGGGIMFDDLYRHFVKNNTDEDRVVLFVDVLRPMKSKLLTKANNKLLKFVSKSKRILNAAKKAESQINA
jgi:beta-hydroxylase